MKKRIAVCPTDIRHDKFVTVAHVSENWIVDREGNFERVASNPDQQMIHGPTEDNEWRCATCGSCADFTDAEDFGTDLVLTAIVCDHCSHQCLARAEAGPCRDCIVVRPSNFKSRP